MKFMILLNLVDAPSENASKPTTPVEPANTDPQAELGLTDDVKVRQ